MFKPMSTPLVFVAFVALAVVFGVLVTVITLRFLTVLQQTSRADSEDRTLLMRQLDLSHTQAFTNAMTAMQTTQQRVMDSQTDMFNRTMDMVHGPVPTETSRQPLTVDDLALDMRPAWQPDDDGDGIELMIDPTDEDEWLALGSDVMHDDMNGRAVSVRPGETLVPGQ